MLPVSKASTSAATSASLVKFDVFKLCGRRRKLQPEIEQQDRTDDRHDETGRVKRRSGRWFRQESRDQAADDRTGDAQQRAVPEPEALSQGELRNPANDGTDNNGPDDV